MTERLQSIQCLRGIAACLVVGFHFIGIAGKFYPDAQIGEPLIAFLRQGWIGIDLFFVVSGFIIALTTERSRGPRDALDYLRRRLIRIVPIYWVLTIAMALVVLAMPVRDGDVPITPLWVALSLGFWPPKAWGYDSPILFVGWTLSYEMLFYTIVFIALALRAKPLIPFAILSFVFTGAVIAPEAAKPFAWMTNSIVLEFLMGYGVFRIYRARRLRVPPAACLLVAGFIAMGASTLFVPDTTIWRAFANGLSVSAFVLGAANLERNTKLSPPAWTVALGDASYSIYLMQCFTLPLAAYLFPMIGFSRLGPTAICIAGVLLTAAFGYAVYALAERPMLYAAKRAFGRRAPRPATAS